MAIHKVSSLISKGFTMQELNTFIDAKLMYDMEGSSPRPAYGRRGRNSRTRTYGHMEMLQTTKSPSSWPKAYRSVWDSHTEHGNRGTWQEKWGN